MRGPMTDIEKHREVSNETQRCLLIFVFPSPGFPGSAFINHAAEKPCNETSAPCAARPSLIITGGELQEAKINN